MAQTLHKNEKVKFLALGDSYTIGESVAEDQRWPVQLINTLQSSGYMCDTPTIVATTGWRTDDLKRAIHVSNLPTDYTLVSLLIGVNNQYQNRSVANYKPEFEELLQIAIKHVGGDQSKVYVVSIPDYGFTPFGKEKRETISKAIDEFNAANKLIAEKYRITYIDITSISRRGLSEPDLIASDGLHPSGKMYSLWTDLILHKLLKKD